MDVPQSIGITQAGQPSLTLTVLEESRIRFYATVVSDEADGPGWAQAPDGHYWRLDVPPSWMAATGRREKTRFRKSAETGRVSSRRPEIGD